MNDAYFEPITIKRKEENTPLGQKPEFLDITSDIDVGFIQPLSGNEIFQYAKGGQNITVRMYTPIENTELEYLDRVTQNGRSYTVIYADQQTGISGVGDHLEILMGKFKDG